jgi:hypothetical protein
VILTLLWQQFIYSFILLQQLEIYMTNVQFNISKSMPTFQAENQTLLL